MKRRTESGSGPKTGERLLTLANRPEWQKFPVEYGETMVRP